MTATTPPPTYGTYFGLSVTMPSINDVDWARLLGFGWIRGGAECGWAAKDIDAQIAVANYARDHGVKFIWCSNLAGHTYTTDKLKAWGDYHAYVARGGVTRFEIGNEWNNDGFWKPYDKSWVTQAAFANRAASEIRAIRPKARIITCGMSPYGNDDGGTNNRWPQRAIPMLWKLLTPGLFNGVGNHLYSHPEDPRWHWDDHPGWGAAWRNRDVWAAIKSYGFPIFNTEFGSMSTEFSTETARRDHFTKYIAEFDAQRKAGVKFGAHFLHTLRDGSSYIVGQETPTWGIITADGKPKSPTMEYFVDLMKQPW